MTTGHKWGIVEATAQPPPNDPCPFAIGEVGIYEALVKYFEQYFPKLTVISGQNNRAGLPKPPLILIQTLVQKWIATDEVRYSDDSMFIKGYSEILVRIDFYGSKNKRASDIGTRFRILWNNSLTSDFFRGLNIPLFPLYVKDINLRPLTNSEDQYSDRYTCDVHLEYHPEVQVLQESATELIFQVAIANNK